MVSLQIQIILLWLWTRLYNSNCVLDLFGKPERPVWYMIIMISYHPPNHLLVLNWGEPSINQPTSEKRASMKLIKDCEHSQPPTSATANQLCCVDCSTWIITLHWCNLEKTPSIYLIRWPWHAFQNIWTPSVSVCVCVSPRNRFESPVLMKNYPWYPIFRCF